MKTEALTDLLDQIDWESVHLMRLDESGRRVEFWLEGGKLRPIVMDQNTWQPDAVVIGSLPCWGCNLDQSQYAEGWATETESGGYLTDDGRSLSAYEMLCEAIAEGDHAEAYDDWQDQIVAEYCREQEWQDQDD